MPIEFVQEAWHADVDHFVKIFGTTMIVENVRDASHAVVVEVGAASESDLLAVDGNIIAGRSNKTR